MKPSLYSKPERAARHAAGYAYTLIRSGRRTLAIEIKEDAGVLVRALQRLPLWQIEAFWSRAGVDRRKACAGAPQAQARDAAVPSSSACRCLGWNTPSVMGRPSRRVCRRPILSAGRASCRAVAASRGDLQGAGGMCAAATRFAVCRGDGRGSVRREDQRRDGRWGSCSGKNRTFPLAAGAGRWKLWIMVVHELAHIREHNHSQRFWRLVERYQPDYRRAQELLKTLARRLHDEWAL
ncbi:MAG: YgjP-like metallopeptidase domain-containing protein [Oscillospiraceae bacterium]